MGAHAFHTVLSQKAHLYGPILRSLEFEMGLSKFRHVKKHLREVTKEGFEMLGILSF